MASATFSEWHQRGRQFHFGDSPIFYQDEGVGDVVFCLHGFPTASWDWVHIWHDLSSRFRVIAPDLLGYGYSAKPRRHDYSISEQADLCEALLQHLEIDRVHILAHDIGDNVVQELLVRHLEKAQLGIESVCLLNGGIFPEKLSPRLIQRLLLVPYLGAMIMRFYTRDMFARQFSAVFGMNTQPSANSLDEYWTLIDHNKGQAVMPQLMGYIPEGIQSRERWVGGLQISTVPSKFIFGTDDPVSGRVMIERLVELMPDADVSCLEAIGHYPHIESPQETLSCYLEFLDSLV